jgi:hypothetical protein
MPKDELPGAVLKLPAPCEPGPAPAGGAATAAAANTKQKAAARPKVCILMSLPFRLLRSTVRLTPWSRPECVLRCLLIDSVGRGRIQKKPERIP